MPRRRKRPISAAPPPQWKGDHGTGTPAANAGTEVRPLDGANPNRFARRQRINQVDRLKPRLSLRQYQAAMALQAAHCAVEALSSGTPLRARVDATPRPDTAVAAKVDAVSRLVWLMDAVPTAMRDVVTHVCLDNQPLRQMVKGRAYYNRMADLQVALDLVANKLRY